MKLHWIIPSNDIDSFIECVVMTQPKAITAKGWNIAEVIDERLITAI